MYNLSDHSYHQKILTGDHGLTVTSLAANPLSLVYLVLEMVVKSVEQDKIQDTTVKSEIFCIKSLNLISIFPGYFFWIFSWIKVVNNQDKF